MQSGRPSECNQMQSGRPSERRYTHLPNLAPHQMQSRRYTHLPNLAPHQMQSRRYTHLPNLARHVGAPLLFATNVKPAHSDESHHLIEQRT